MSIHDQYAEQVIAARDHDLAEAHRRIDRLERLVRDLWEFGFGCNSGANDARAWHERTDELKGRMRELGIGVDA